MRERRWLVANQLHLNPAALAELRTQKGPQAHMLSADQPTELAVHTSAAAAAVTAVPAAAGTAACAGLAGTVPRRQKVEQAFGITHTVVAALLLLPQAAMPEHPPRCARRQ